MSLYDYKLSLELSKDDYPFDAIIMTAMRKADDINLAKLSQAFPNIWKELRERYHAPGGLLESDLQ